MIQAIGNSIQEIFSSGYSDIWFQFWGWENEIFSDLVKPQHLMIQKERGSKKDGHYSCYQHANTMGLDQIQINEA